MHTSLTPSSVVPYQTINEDIHTSLTPSSVVPYQTINEEIHTSLTVTKRLTHISIAITLSFMLIFYEEIKLRNKI